jgi:hypothetical protein
MYICRLQNENHKQQSWKKHQATECEDIQVKAEDHGITWWTMNFQSPKEILKPIQQTPVIVHELTSPNKLYQISILRLLRFPQAAAGSQDL